MRQNLWDDPAIPEEYKSWLLEQGKADGTVYSYTLNIQQYMKWHTETFGAEMTALRHVNVLDYRSYLQSVKKDAAGTVNAKLAALISLDDFLTATGRQGESAVSRKDLLRVQAAYTNPSDVSEKEVEAFRQAILEGACLRDYALVTIMAYAGLRVSEAVNLGLEDVDCVGKQIAVCRGKGNKERVVFIGDKVVHAVREYLKEREFDTGWLFPGRGGGHLHRSVANKLFNCYSDKITPHKLRHFYCSTALEKGYSYHELANQAGHANIHTTLRYTNPTQEVMKDKANKL
jgi:site-specific recombinase XerD